MNSWTNDALPAGEAPDGLPTCSSHPHPDDSSKGYRQSFTIGSQSVYNDIQPDAPSVLPDSPLFEGDTGSLKGETRRCLVALLSGPSVDGRRQPALWQVLIRDRRVLQSRLHEIFLELVVDTEQQVGFIRQITSDDGDSIPILLRRQQLTFIDSALILFLRQRLTEADSANERAVVSVQEMTDHLSVFEKANNTDGVKFDKQCTAAIEKCKQLNLIRPIRASNGRLEVSPTLKLLFSAEDIQTLIAAYETLATPVLRDDGETLADTVAEDTVEGAEPDSVDAEENDQC